MKPRQTLILLLVVVAVISGIAVYEYGVRPRLAADKEAASLLFPDLDSDKATRIEILKGSTLSVMVRDGDTAWKVETRDNYPADPDAVNSVLEALKEMKEGILSSKSKKNHARLGVDEGGLRVKVSAGTSMVADLFVGEQGKNYGTTFVRKQGSDKVYLVSENLKSKFDKDSSAWRDKGIFSEELENVSELQLVTWPEPESEEESGDTGAETMTIRKNAEADAWELVLSGDSVEKLDKSKVDALVRGLVTMRAAEFADDATPAEAGIEPPQKKATFTLSDGKSHSLLVGYEKDSKYYVKREDRDVIQMVYQYNINNVFKEKDALVPLPGDEEDIDPSSFLPAPQLERDLEDDSEE